VLFIDAEPAGESMEETVARIGRAKPSALVVAVGDAARPEAALGALRAGAGEVILPPFEEQVPGIMDRLAAKIGNRVRPIEARLVALVSAKGGCGATTLACHLASYFNTTTPLSVLLLDLDFNAGLSGFLLKAESQYTIVDVAVNAFRMDASLWRQYISRCRPRLDVLPSPMSTVFREDFRPATVHEALRTAAALYGWVIADLGRGLNPFSAELVSGFDDICLVVTPTASAVYQAAQVAARAVECGLPRTRIRLTVNQTHPHQRMDLREIERLTGLQVFADIRYRAGIEKALLEGRLVQADSGYGRDCASLALKLEGPPPASETYTSLFGLLGHRKPAGAQAI
jgi:pilus assembly protein CpaE